MGMGLLLLALFFFQSEQEGIKALDAQKYDEAVQIFSKLAAAEPKDYSAHFYLALSYSLLNRDKEAIASYSPGLSSRTFLYSAIARSSCLELIKRLPNNE